MGRLRSHVLGLSAWLAIAACAHAQDIDEVTESDVDAGDPASSALSADLSFSLVSRSGLTTVPESAPTQLAPGGAEVSGPPIADEFELHWPEQRTAFEFPNPRPPVIADSLIRFGEDAADLTPLAGGERLLSFEIAERFSLSGVGARRLQTPDQSALVFSAEAGVALSPSADLQLGYELLQTSVENLVPEQMETDSIFARFRLRF